MELYTLGSSYLVIIIEYNVIKKQEQFLNFIMCQYLTESELLILGRTANLLRNIMWTVLVERYICLTMRTAVTDDDCIQFEILFTLQNFKLNRHINTQFFHIIHVLGFFSLFLTKQQKVGKFLFRTNPSRYPLMPQVITGKEPNCHGSSK